MGEPVAALIRSVALGLWALVLLRSAADGRLDLLLRAVFHPLVQAGGWLLLLLALAQLLVALQELRRARAADREAARRRGARRELLGGGLTAGATAAVAGLMLALPPNPSFAELARQRPSEDSSDPGLSFTVPPAQRSLTDWVRLLRSYPDPALHAGEPVRISGFVLPMPEGPPQLARLLVRCCLADATPVGLPVRWPRGATPVADRWLAIEGRLERQGDGLVVVPSQIRSIPRPARPLEP